MSDSYKIYASKDYVNEQVNQLSEEKLDKGSPAIYQQMVTDASGAPTWEDRTHYDDIQTIIWDGSTDGLVQAGGNIYKVSDLTPSSQYISEGKFEFTASKSSITYKNIMHFSPGNNYAISFQGTTVYVIVEAPVTIEGRTYPEAGTYFNNNRGSYLTSLSWGELKQLDEKYLPSTVPVIQTATVGQTIAVKAVDENGKPTEWEAVDTDSGLPSDATAYQQLVTDSEGNVKWVERDFYKTIGTIIVPNATYGIYSSYGQNITGTFTIPTIGETYHVIFGDIETDKVAIAGNNGVRIGEDYNEFIIEIINETQMYVETANSGPKVIEITQNALKKIDQMFLPDLPQATEEIFGVVKTTDFAGQKNNASGEIFNDYTNNIASGNFSHAENFATEALGSNAHAEGSYAIAEGESSHAEGNKTYSLGEYSHTEGYNTEALGIATHAEGVSTEAFGSAAHAECSNTKAVGNYSHAEGNEIRVEGEAAHGEGKNHTANLNITPTEDELVYSYEGGYASDLLPGYYIKVRNSDSPFVEILENNYASRTFKVKESLSITEKTSISVSYGLIRGNSSHGEGYCVTTVGTASHAEGYNTSAIGDYQHVQGKYNITDTENKYAHIVGNGTDITHSNAHTLDWNGLGWFANGLKVGGTGQDDETAVEVALKTDIPTDDYINSLIDAKIASIPNGEEVAY